MAKGLSNTGTKETQDLAEVAGSQQEGRSSQLRSTDSCKMF